jgi:histone H2B
MSGKKPAGKAPAGKAPISAGKAPANKAPAGKSPAKAVGAPIPAPAGKAPTKAAGKAPAKTAGTGGAAGKAPAKTTAAGKTAAKTAASKQPGEKKPTPSNAATKKAANKKRKTDTYQSYIYKILKQVGSGKGIGISNKGMMVMNSFVEDLFDRIATEASHLTHLGNKGTLGAREIATAAKLVLPADLGKHACMEAQKAVTKYVADKRDHKKPRAAAED